jgi:hypothetical protein
MSMEKVSKSQVFSLQFLVNTDKLGKHGSPGSVAMPAVCAIPLNDEFPPSGMIGLAASLVSIH